MARRESITIEGGDITATGGHYSAGIGGGGGTITIRNGVVTANGGEYGAGIGGGSVTDSGNILIEGGTVSATGGYYSAGHRRRSKRKRRHYHDQKRQHNGAWGYKRRGHRWGFRTVAAARS